VAASIPVLSEESATRRETFFKVIFDKAPNGYLCIARRVMRKGAFEEKFFQWPDELPDLGAYITASVMNHDMWFCPMLFDSPARRKESVDTCPSVWADLDGCVPDNLLIPATVLLESSPERYQALWILESIAEPLEAEDASKRIAYFHADQGADKSGWDLTQLLRIPFTYNYKYDVPAMVKILTAGNRVTLDSLSVYPMVAEDANALWPFPETIEDSDTLLDRHKNELDPVVWRLFGLEPETDWSKALWNLEMLLCESALPRDAVFGIVRDAKCNKYRRDGRSEKMLWREVCKAWAKVQERSAVVPDAATFKNPELLSDADLTAMMKDRTFIDDYIDWAKGVGDAAEQYHQAGAFTCLSALLSGAVQLPTSYGMIKPNLWFLLLADTTLTRKSTALDLAIELLLDVDDDVILATDGSIEGLFSALALRPGRPSIFLRDEFSGLIEMMTKRDYYAGMAEVFTKMYDGKFQKRQLRREVIEVRDPILIMLAGGIRTKILALLTDEHIYSGFIPRFVCITAQSNIGRLKDLGPPEPENVRGRNELQDRLQAMKDHYQREAVVKAGKLSVATTYKPDVILTPSAWGLYNAMERRLLESGIRSTSQASLTAVMDRLSKSGLKAAILIAASRMKDTRVVVDEGDIFKAFSYVTDWRAYALEVISSVGMSQTEHKIGVVFAAIKKSPGVSRSQLMQNYHLMAREADQIFQTLEQRGLISRTKTGKTERLTALL